MPGLLLFCGAITGLVTTTALTVLIPNEIRGVCLGAFIVGGAVIGFGVSPTIVTLGSTLLGGGSHLDLALALPGMATSLLALIGFAVAMVRSTPIAHRPDRMPPKSFRVCSRCAPRPHPIL